MTHTITPTSSLERPLAQPAMSQMLAIPDSLSTEVEAAGIDATGSNAAKRGDASSGFAMVKKQKVTGGMSAEKRRNWRQPRVPRTA